MTDLPVGILVNMALEHGKDQPRLSPPMVRLKIPVINADGEVAGHRDYSQLQDFEAVTNGRFTGKKELTSKSFVQLVKDEQFRSELHDSQITEAAQLYVRSNRPTGDTLLSVNKTLACVLMARHGLLVKSWSGIT